MTHRLLPKPDAGTDDTAPDDMTELKWEFDEDSRHYYVSFPVISSGAQLGRSGTMLHLGFIFILVP